MTRLILEGSREAKDDFIKNFIKENSIPYNVVEGLTSIGKPGFVGPCPNSGKHHYIFTIFALDLKLNLNSTSDISMLKNTIQNHILEQTELIGLYQRNK